MKNYKFKFWHYGLLLTLLAVALITYNLEASDKSYFLSGETSHGHHQVEMACSSCHGDGFAGQDFIQQACLNCHQEELLEADDSHPRKKFLDPRNAGLLNHLDARLCVSCHTEHKPEITHDMGVTLAGDFCVHCHSDIAENRPNHAGFGFETCASAGCHNYHDNRYLYEDFLIAQMDSQDLLPGGKLPERSALARWQSTHPESMPLSIDDADLNPQEFSLDITSETLANIHRDWSSSIHAQTETNCRQCHVDGRLQFTSAEIVNVCGNCHEAQRDKFTQGKHGLRLSAKLPASFRENTGAMTPVEAHVAMKESANAELNCTSCHQAHAINTRYAAVEACLGCHNDEHSLAYRASAHFDTWQKDASGGVSCASCHLPRELHNGELLVNHNQNHNLRPNEKMLPVCLNCHGAEFAIAALADRQQIERNFSVPPSKGHETFKLIRERIAKIKSSK
ncbi:cytochrome c3 family protein [Microbulbifer sp. ALW1]|uniref:cytochrome c3 family protein n=1 Tax=Microbulbifer sp. (strain ALW1) TaxID=1516059 RepID=UPI0013572F56|nr:cytochrome c3 family protein [Microbulbifer sp. ALW1]